MRIQLYVFVCEKLVKFKISHYIKNKIYMITKSRTAKLAIGFVGAAVALSFAITQIMASAATIAELQAMIADLSAQLAALSGGATAMSSYTFSANLTVGSTGTDVKIGR